MARRRFLFTARYVAELLGEDEALITDIAYDNLGPEDGCFAVDDGDLEQHPSVTVFDARGIDCLQELLADLRHMQQPPKT